MPKKNRIDSFDKKIFGDLFRASRPLPMKRISKRTGISWPTVKNHVIKLRALGAVDVHKSIRRTNVSISGAMLREAEKRDLI